MTDIMVAEEQIVRVLYNEMIWLILPLNLKNGI
jgi:hypothetical protein